MQTANQAFVRYILLLPLLLLCGGYAGAQGNNPLNKAVSFSGTHITLGKAMSEIESQTGFTFVFNAEQVNTGMVVQLDQNRLSVNEALSQMFNGSSLKHVIRSRFIGIDPTGSEPQQDNEAAPTVETPLTNDRYQRSAGNDNTDPLRRGNSHIDGFYETERIVSYVSDEAPKRVYPVSYSNYTSASAYAGQAVSLPRWTIKTNLLYGAATLAPNLGIEIATAPRQTFELSGGYSWKGRTAAASDEHEQLAQLLVRAEYRWWMCERFNGHYFGAHAFYGGYYVSNRDIPLLFKKEHSYDGWALAAGMTYGYHWAVSKRIGLEFNIGVGYAYMDYERGTCSKCYPDPVQKTKHYFGPTRAGINLVFMIQ